MPEFADYMVVLFEPLIAAAKRPDLDGKLITADLPVDRKEAQFAKLSSLKKAGDGPIYFGPAGFIARFYYGNETFFCVSAEQLNTQENADLEDWAESQELIKTELDESTFLFLTYNFRSLYRVKSAYLQQQDAENMIDVPRSSGEYEFDINDVINWYERIVVFQVPRDSLFLNSTDFKIAAHLTAANKAFRSPLIDDDTVIALRSLLLAGNVNPELVFFALTSSHWKHVFLEVYRCIEVLFFLPWALKLKTIFGYGNSAEDLARSVHNEFPYRPQEKESMRDLFALAGEATVKSSYLAEVKCFNGLISQIDASTGAFGERVYRLRNQFVHLRDYNHSEQLTVTLDCWPILVKYLCSVVIELYTKYREDITFEYKVTGD